MTYPAFAFVQSLLHGSPEAQKAGELDNQQHSKVVGRGKYIHGFEGVCSWSFRHEPLSIPLEQRSPPGEAREA